MVVCERVEYRRIEDALHIKKGVKNVYMHRTTLSQFWITQNKLPSLNTILCQNWTNEGYTNYYDKD